MSSLPELGRLPAGISNLNNFGLSGLIYADKSDLLAELGRQQGPFLLSRPRGFGKSMLLCSLGILFTQGRDPFRRYLLYEQWEETACFPVLHVDFSALCPESYAALSAGLRSRLQNALSCLDIRLGDEDDNDPDPLLPLRRALDGLSAAQRRCVLLLGECDVPLMQALSGGPEFYAQAAAVYRQLFALIRDYSSVLRFTLATSTLSLRPLLGLAESFRDITLDSQFAQLLGFTAEEAREYFEDYIRFFARTAHLSRSEAWRGLMDNYGGYRFDDAGQTALLHPASFLSCLRHPQQGFAPYWEADRPIDALISRKYAPAPGRQGTRQLAALCDELSAPRERSALYGGEVGELADLDDAALLYQAGYLTIHEVHDGQFVLGRANRQSDRALVKVLVG